MRFLPLTVACPGCGSAEVVYSCSPDCCFNHVCGDCLNSFELITKDSGGTFTSPITKTAERDSCAPTAQCARCESLELYQVEAGDIVCASCRALLELGFAAG